MHAAPIQPPAPGHWQTHISPPWCHLNINMMISTHGKSFSMLSSNSNTGFCTCPLPTTKSCHGANFAVTDSMLCHKQRLSCPDSKSHGANMGPIWGRQDPGGPHVCPMNFAICVALRWPLFWVFQWYEHEDIMIWSRFPHYPYFMRGIHQSSMWCNYLSIH